MVTVKTVSQPAVEPVDLPTAKLSCGVYDTTFDALFQIWIRAAREAAEQYTGRAFFNRQMLLSMDYFPWGNYGGTIGAGSEQALAQLDYFNRGYTIEMPTPGLVSVQSLTYQTMLGASQTLVSGVDFYIDTTSEPGRLVPMPGAYWATNLDYIPGTIQINYTAGTYGDGVNVNTCPAAVQIAILLAVGHMFQNRESVTILQGTVPSVLPLGWSMHLDTVKFCGKTFGTVA